MTAGGPLSAQTNGEEDQPRLAGIDESQTEQPEEKVAVAVETSAEVPSEAKSMGEVVPAPAVVEEKPETASEYSSQFFYIRNAQAFNEGKLKDFSEVGVRAPDAYTVEVTLNNPTPFFLDLCAFSTLLPVHMPSVEAWEKRGESWTTSALVELTRTAPLRSRISPRAGATAI